MALVIKPTKNMTVKIFGHWAPDTDATCSPIIWAWYLSEIKGTPVKPYLLEEPNKEALFALEYFGHDRPEILGELTIEDKVVVVDTNNPKELPSDIEKATIVQIIDHHKLAGGLITASPLEVTMKPLASTASVMWSIMTPEERDQMPNNIAGLMLACVLSDTLEFRSPTTTDYDKEIAEKLAKRLNLDITAFAGEMFAAKSDISDFSNAELLRMDSKLFELAAGKMRVSVLETTAPDLVFNRSEELIDEMAVVAKEDEVDHVLLFVVDILNEEATLLISNEEVRTIAEKAFEKISEGERLVLPGVVSRKKQIVPALS